MKNIGLFLAFPFGFLLLFGMLYLMFQSTGTATKTMSAALKEHEEQKINENPSILEKEPITNIQFTIENGLLSKTEKILVTTEKQTYAFFDLFTSFELSQSNESYLEKEIRFPNTKDEKELKRIFLSKEDLIKYSEDYATTFGTTLNIKNE